LDLPESIGCRIKNRDQPLPAIIDVAPDGKQMTADTSEGHAFRPFVILLPSTLGALRETL